MSAIDLAILGIVLERPQSAYEIQKDVVYHNFSKWTKISIPSVYKKVLKLCEQGYLDSTMLPGDKAVSRAVYSVTQKGEEYFHELMEEYAKKSINFLFDFNVVITNLSKVQSAKANKLLEQLHKNIEKSANSNLELLDNFQDLPIYAKTIFWQQQQLYQALLEWLEEFEVLYSNERNSC